MKKFSTLSLPTSGSVTKLERGKLDMAKGRKAVGIRLKATVQLANTSGGTVVLSDTQKQNLLACFFATLDYGPNGIFKPFPNTDFKRIHRLQRFAYGSEMEGYSDSTTGMAQSMTTGNTFTLVFYPIIPTGKLWMLRDLQNQMGLGRSAMRSVQLELRRVDTTIVSGVAITGTPTFDVILDEVSCEGDQFAIIPHWNEQDETDKVVRSPEGLPLLVSERTAVHASTSLTNISLQIDGEVVHDQVSPGELITQYNDGALTPTAASLTDRETLLYAVDDQVPLRFLPTGAVKVTQNVKDLATFKLGHYYVPIASRDSLEDTVKHVASSLRNKTVRLSSLIHVEGHADKIPPRLQPYFGFRLLDTDDKEIEKVGGLQASPGSPAAAVIPKGQQEALRLAAAHHRSAGETKAVDDLAKRAASQIPGAIQSSRGLSGGNGTPILNDVRRSLA